MHFAIGAPNTAGELTDPLAGGELPPAKNPSVGLEVRPFGPQECNPHSGGSTGVAKSLVPPLKPPQMKIRTLVLSLHSVYMKTFGATSSTSYATP